MSTAETDPRALFPCSKHRAILWSSISWARAQQICESCPECQIKEAP